MSNIGRSIPLLFTLALSGSLHAATLPALNSNWRYFKGTAEASAPDATAWRAINFNDSGWFVGAAPLRYNIGSGGTLLSDMTNSYSCVFMRQTFTLSAADLAAIPQLMLNIDFNDGFIVWINGVQVKSLHAPAVVNRSALAAELHTAGAPEIFDLPNPSSYLVVGTNVMAVQAFNVTKGSSTANNAPDDFLINPELLVSSGPVADTQFNFTRGFYTNPINVAITTSTSGATIRYTTDCSRPSLFNGITYVAPIPISSTTVLRVAAFKTGMLPTNVDTHTYIFLSSVKTQTRPVAPNSYPTTFTDPANGSTTTGDYDVDSRIVNNTGGINSTYTFDQAMTDIPSLCIGIEFNDLFSSTRGIYMFSSKSGPSWERGCSFELLNPNNTPGFKYDCSLSMAGAASRTQSNQPKHSLRIHFKDDWGAPRLDYPILGPAAAPSFDTLELRAVFNNSWTNSGASSRAQATYAHVEFARRLQRATGQPSTHGSYYHVYLNGLYWGMYNAEELPDSSFASSYLGGADTDWDSVNAGNVKDGDNVAFLAMNAIVGSGGTFPNVPGVSQNTQYQNLKNYMDLDNLIDYYIMNTYIGNSDWDNGHNWYGVRRREVGAGYKFISWDPEISLASVTANNLTTNNANAPTGYFQKLRTCPDFRIRVADHLHKHLTHNGCMTPGPVAALYLNVISQIDKAVVGESARWGDNRVPATPCTRDATWVNYRTVLVGNPPASPPANGSFFAGRTANLLNEYRSPPIVNGEGNSLYPAFEPPEFSMESGNIPAGGFTLTLSNPPTNPTTNFTMYYTLDGSDPRVSDSVNGPGGAIQSVAINGGLGASIPINSTTTVRARFLQSNATWSAIHEATYTGSQNLAALKITELMYHPIPLAGQTEEKFEFIELKNTGAQALNLSGVQVWGKAGNPTPLYSFPAATILNAGQFYLLVFDQVQFRARYPLPNYPTAVINGVYTAKLDNGGQIVSLKDSSGATFYSVTYNDKAPWPAGADGNGFSIVPTDPNINPDPNNSFNWRGSANTGGSPGSDDPPPPAITPVVINEILANSILPSVDVIELYNPSPLPADVSNWYLTDDHTTPKKFRIPPATIIPPDGYLSFDESQFNPTPPVSTGFSLSSHGEEVYLYSADPAGNLTGYSDGFSFNNSEGNVSFGRYSISTGEVHYPPQITTTFGAANLGPRVGPVVISEMLYLPAAGQDEFIELKNITNSDLSLFDPANPANTWKINGVGFSFPQNASIPANGLLLVTALDPATFRAKYSVPATTQIFGPYAGTLQDDGETIELQKPDVPYIDNNSVPQVPYVVVDAVKYQNGAPWPVIAAGAGYSLERIVPTQYGNDPINWHASAVSGGSPGRLSGATWGGAADGLNWTTVGNWDSAPFASDYTVLNFPDAGASGYTAMNNNAGTFMLNHINLSGTRANSVSGNALDFEGIFPGLTQNGSGTFSLSNAMNLGPGFNVDGTGTGSVTLTGTLSGSASLIKAGACTLVLSGANTYSGATAVSSGTLQIDGSLDAQAAGLTVNANAVLRGVGIINRALSAGGLTGRIFPGDTPLSYNPKGTLTALSADFSNGVLTIRASNSVAGQTAESDRLVLLGSSSGGPVLALGGNSKLELVLNLRGGVYTNQYTPLLQTSAGALITNKFASIVCTNVPGTVIGGPGNPQPVSVVYLAGAVEVEPAITPADTIALKLNAAVTPVTIDAFTASRDGAGVLLTWTALSEYHNAGFNIYRRCAERSSCSVQPGTTETEPERRSTWTSVNPVLIPGRITNPDPKTYRLFDWSAPGSYEYKLESVNIHGVKEPFAELCTVQFEAIESTAAAVTADGMDAALENTRAVRMMERGIQLSSSQAIAPRAFIAVVEAARTIPSPRGSALRNTKPPMSAPLPAARFFTAEPLKSSESINATKVVYDKAGVLLVPQASLPAGFDVRRVNIQREGRALPALAAVDNTLLVYAPGYQDDYTRRDALFLRRTNKPSATGVVPHAQGLFDQPAALETPATVTMDYHDVYFDFSLRPFTFAPWFSNQYLTAGSTQEFILDTPLPAGGPASLSVTLWSVTDSEHALKLFVNGRLAGEADWSGGNKMLTLSFNLPDGVLKDGANQIEFVTPRLSGLDAQIALLHSISVTYNRSLIATTPIKLVNETSLAKLFEVAGLPSGDAWVVDTRYPDRAALLPYESQAQADGSFKLRTWAKAGGSGSVLVVPVGQENQPLGVNKRIVKPLKPSTYLATGPSQFAAGVQPLLALHAKEGLRSQFADQEQLFDYYNYGRFGPAAIQKAVQATRPQYLLLLGRTTYDYLNYSGADVDPLCPTFLVSTTFWAQATSDSAFGDLGRGIPEIAVGRLPVNDPGELQAAVKHILSYRAPLASGVRLHAAADQPDPDTGNFGMQCDAIRQSHPELEWQANYLGSTYATAPEVTEALAGAANGGADWILYAGHGNSSRLGLTVPRILDTEGVQAWKGNVIFIQSTCTANWMAKNETGFKSIAIQALTQPQGGISASIASSTYMNSQTATEFMNQLLLNANTNGARWGGALLKAQRWSCRQGGAFYSDLGKTEQIFGDPAMPVFSMPKPTSKTNNPPGSF